MTTTMTTTTTNNSYLSLLIGDDDNKNDDNDNDVDVDDNDNANDVEDAIDMAYSELREHNPNVEFGSISTSKSFLKSMPFSNSMATLNIDGCGDALNDTMDYSLTHQISPWPCCHHKIKRLLLSTFSLVSALLEVLRMGMPSYSAMAKVPCCRAIHMEYIQPEI